MELLAWGEGCVCVCVCGHVLLVLHMTYGLSQASLIEIVGHTIYICALRSV